jgi:hypothetical protein
VAIESRFPAGRSFAAFGRRATSFLIPLCRRCAGELLHNMEWLAATSAVGHLRVLEKIVLRAGLSRIGRGVHPLVLQAATCFRRVATAESILQKIERIAKRISATRP